jgi:hypothetical protein
MVTSNHPSGPPTISVVLVFQAHLVGTAIATAVLRIYEDEKVARSTVRWLATSGGLIAAGYGTYAGLAWFRYGHPKFPGRTQESDPLLDRFMPAYEVAERHCVRVSAPANITLSAACDQNLQSSKIIRAIFKAREFILGSRPNENPPPRGLLAQVKALGWGTLAQIPHREIVMGAVTRPWEAIVVFRAVPPEEFATFQEPGYVKIVWTLRADPVGAGESVFLTETRVVTTDARARAKFRLYWSFFSPGIALVRRLSLSPLKAEAERRCRTGTLNARVGVRAG